jgi:hypothetical protein
MGNRHSPNVQGAQLGPAHQRGFFCVGAKPVTRISTGAYLGTVFLRAIPFSGAEAPLVLNSMANLIHDIGNDDEDKPEAHGNKQDIDECHCSFPFPR